MTRKPPEILTIGVYGATEESFFSSLSDAGVDTFIDVRRRRGVRGSEFAFVNSQRLQFRLAELGIRYVYLKELAPTNDIRDAQKKEDARTRTAKRQRGELGTAFRAAYTHEILDVIDPSDILAKLPNDAKVVALFCVERAPAACHRSLVAEKLGQSWGKTVKHLMP